MHVEYCNFSIRTWYTWQIFIMIPILMVYFSKNSILWLYSWKRFYFSTNFENKYCLRIPEIKNCTSYFIWFIRFTSIHGKVLLVRNKVSVKRKLTIYGKKQDNRPEMESLVLSPTTPSWDLITVLALPKTES